MTFHEYELISDALYLGERPKGNIFKPCIKTIPYSQISGALNAKFGKSTVKAAGYLTERTGHNETSYLIYSPRDRYLGKSKVPLEVQFLTNVLGKVFVLEDEDTRSFPESFEISLGGLRSKGFGRCALTRISIIREIDIGRGTLATRIPVKLSESFAIRNVLRPVYGYLFEPIPGTFTGNYILSLFEGSEVAGAKFLLKQLEGKSHG